MVLPYIAAGGLLLALSAGSAYLDAKMKLHLSFVEEGTMEFVMAGENLRRVLVNVDGYVLTKDGIIKPISLIHAQPGEIVATADEIRNGQSANWFNEVTGLYWISAFYPWKRVHEFEIIKLRLIPRSEAKEGATLRQRMQHDQPETVKNLRFRFPRPFLFEEADCKDGIRVDLLVGCNFQIVMPKITIFKIGGKFFTTLESIVNSRVIDYMKQRTYKKFRTEEKGVSSPFSTFMRNMNDDLIRELGIRINSAWIDEFSISGTDLRAQEASEANELEKLEGQAKLTKANFDRQVKEQEAIGNAAGVKELAMAYEAHPIGAAHVSRQLVSENLGKGNLTVLGSGAMTLIDPDAKIRGGRKALPAPSGPTVPTPPPTPPAPKPTGTP